MRAAGGRERLAARHVGLDRSSDAARGRLLERPSPWVNPQSRPNSSALVTPIASSRPILWGFLAPFLALGTSLAASGAIAAFMVISPAGLRGADFHVFDAAAWALLHGLDPYRAGELVRGSLAVAATYLNQPTGAFPYLPWVGWSMAPWTLLPYTLAFAAWGFVAFAVVLASARLLAGSLRWRRPWLIAVVAALSPVAFLGYQVGQMDAVMFALVVAVVAAAGKGKWLLAGACSMAVVLLKPQVTLPLLPLLVVFAVRERGPLRSVLAGQALSLLILVGLPEVLQPALLPSWLTALTTFSHGIAQRPASLMGALALLRMLPNGWHIATGIGSPVTLALAAAGAAGIVLFLRSQAAATTRRVTSTTTRAGRVLLLPLAIWLLVCPYVHPYDVLVLLPLVMLILTPGPGTSTPWQGWAVLAAFGLLPVAFLINTDALAVAAGPLATLAIAIVVVLGWGRGLTGPAPLADVTAEA